MLKLSLNPYLSKSIREFGLSANFRASSKKANVCQLDGLYPQPGLTKCGQFGYFAKGEPGLPLVRGFNYPELSVLMSFQLTRNKWVVAKLLSSNLTFLLAGCPYGVQ